MSNTSTTSLESFLIEKFQNTNVFDYVLNSNLKAVLLRTAREDGGGDTIPTAFRFGLNSFRPRIRQFEPNDAIAEATSTGLSGSGTFTGSAFIGDGLFGTTSGDYDYFRFSADAGDNISIETFATTNLDILGVDTVVGLYDSSGTLLAFDDDGGSGVYSDLDFTVGVTGEYYAVVRGFGFGFASVPFTPGTGGGVGTTGFYGLEIEITDGGSGGPFEPNDAIAEATSTGLSGSGTFTGSAFIGDGLFGTTSGDYDYFHFSADAGDNISIETFATANPDTVNTVVGLYDSSGNLLVENDDGGSDLYSALNFTVGAAGDYYAVVRGFGSGFAGDPSTPGTGSGVGSTGAYDLEIEITDSSPVSEFDIDLIFDASIASEVQAIFEQAANRWEELIIGDLPDAFVTRIGIVDDIAIEVRTPFIDGPSGILGQAGPTLVRLSSFLPSVGIIQFDSADVPALEASGQLDEVILHEMAHVLGFGTIWNALGLLSGAGGSDPRFTGADATAEYNSIFGVAEASVPVENTGGLGTRDAHWRESVFDNELMTGLLNGGIENPLSRITVASFGDLGYEVNLAAADPFSLSS
jgi:hypothetical protein